MSDFIIVNFLLHGLYEDGSNSILEMSIGSAVFEPVDNELIKFLVNDRVVSISGIKLKYESEIVNQINNVRAFNARVTDIRDFLDVLQKSDALILKRSSKGFFEKYQSMSVLEYDDVSCLESMS